MLPAPHLTRESEPWGVVTFIHSDGKPHKFYSVVNDMSGSRLSAFDTDPPRIGDSLKWVKSVFRDIKAKATVLDTGGPLTRESAK